RSGARYAKVRTEKMQEILAVAGIDRRRLYFGSASASEADSFAEQVTQFVNSIVKLGPLGKKFPKNLLKKQDPEGVTGR
ncbi:MAG: hydrogenase iron-sulfur subunit, partial [Candidatus Thorarchaeota archaeon]